MSLLNVYKELSARIDKVNFEKLWNGFQRTKFAVYNNEAVCFDGEMLPKTDAFLANTSIEYRGAQIAIWQLGETYDADIIASKIIHEMFHAFQRRFDKLVYPNEMQATLNYRYSPECLSAKLCENRLLGDLVLAFDAAKFEELCALRKYRQKSFPYEMQYEMAVEQIEGTANYVESAALAQLSPVKYQEKITGMIKRIQAAESLFPIRIISYDIGALLIKIIKENQIECSFAFNSDSFMTELMERAREASPLAPSDAVKQLVDDYYRQTQEMITCAVRENERVVLEDATLIGYNTYNARYTAPYLLSSFFVMYEADNREQTLYGDFVVEITPDRKIKKIYRTKFSL